MYWVSWWDGAGVWHCAHSLGLLITGVVGSVTLASKDPVASALTEGQFVRPACRSGCLRLSL